MALTVNAGRHRPKVHPADAIAPRCGLKRHKPLPLAAKQKNHNNYDENQADRASADVARTAKNRRE
jgi:hypothetical protein